MEKRALIAISLSLAVLALWNIFFLPRTQPPGQHPVTPPSEAAAGAPAAPGSTPDASNTERPAPAVPPAAVAAVSSKVVRAQEKKEFRHVTPLQDIRFTNEGGRVTWWKLVKYKVDGDAAVDLIPDSARASGVLPLSIEVKGDDELTKALASALYEHELADIPADDPSGLGPGKRISFAYADGAGLVVHKSLSVPDDGYLGEVSFEITRGGQPLDATIICASGLAEPGMDDTRSYGHVQGQVVIHDGREVARIPAPKVTEPHVFGAAAGTPVKWAGLESTYFAALVLPPRADKPQEAPISFVITPRAPAAAQPAASSQSGGAPVVPLVTAGLEAVGGGSYRLFVGPKDHHLLNAMGYELERVIDFSRFSLIYLCTNWLFHALNFIHSYLGNYGWSIIVLTVAVRLAFFPLTYRSSISMRQTSKKMTKVQPRVKAIQDRYRKMKKSMETQRKMNEEVMAVYAKEGINPMGNLGGCLPLLLQMPIFIAFYNLLAVTIELRHAPFGWWIQDLSRRDPYYITPILMGASWLLQQAMTSSSIPDPTQRRMMMIMPVMFTFFMMNMPSGLVIYWLTSNILGMAQQYITNKKADQLEALAHAPAHAH